MPLMTPGFSLHLRSAGPCQAYVISGGGTGLHWESLDEDISVDGPLLDMGDRSRTWAAEKGPP